jgi:hypothetical protein
VTVQVNQVQQQLDALAEKSAELMARLEMQNEAEAATGS